jgi:type I restriction enzyme M protein
MPACKGQKVPHKSWVCRLAEVFREIARSIATALTKLGIDVPLPNGQSLAAGEPALGAWRGPAVRALVPKSPFTDFRDYLELVSDSFWNP